MDTDSRLFWVLLAVAVCLVGLVSWFGHWLAGVVLGTTVLAYLVTPRLEASAEGEGTQGASRRAWSTLRFDLILIAGCLLAVLVLAYL